jgi:hypothetical protein
MRHPHPPALRRQPVLYVPGAGVRHLVPAERATWSYFRARCWSEGLSKAAVTARIGSDDGLSSERSYVLRTLPRALASGVREGLRGDRGGGSVPARWPPASR